MYGDGDGDGDGGGGGGGGGVFLLPLLGSHVEST